jgi:hypothetical protein
MFYLKHQTLKFSPTNHSHLNPRMYSVHRFIIILRNRRIRMKRHPIMHDVHQLIIILQNWRTSIKMPKITRTYNYHPNPPNREDQHENTRKHNCQGNGGLSTPNNNQYSRYFSFCASTYFVFLSSLAKYSSLNL